MTYDGYGRIKTRHAPQQNAGANTVWDYNSDDTIQKVTDARGASQTLSYNSRHLVTGITYAAPGGSGITVPATVSFAYDAAGNRTSMTDGLGSMSYNYDQLSRLLSETRNFTGLGNHTINYQYNLAGELSSITDPFNATINYTRDSSGRLTGISGTPFGGITTYASNIQYRAWGAIKHLNSGDSRTLDASFNSRLQTSAFTVSGKISKTYDYYADGSLRFSSDLLDHRFDRFYSFDHLKRLKEAFSGAEARGEAATTDRPYKQTFGYDAFSHLTARTTKIWWTADNSISDSYVNNRHVPQGSSWQYDADGRLLNGAGGFYTYDAAGHNTHVEIPSTHSSHATLGMDGDGRQVKTEETTWNEELQTEVTETKYYLRSSVLGGQVLTELGETGGQSRTFVYAGRAVLAWQWRSFGTENVDWEHKDLSGASVRRVGLGQELDPTGADAGTNAQTIIPDEGALISSGSSYNAANPSITYSIDGIRVPAGDFMAFAGIALQDRLLLMEWFARRAQPDVHIKWYRGIPDLTLLPQNPTMIPLGNLRGNLEALLKKGDCLEYTTKLLAEAAKRFAGNYPHLKTIMEGYEKITGPGQGGYVFKKDGYDTVGGDLFAKGASPGTVLLLQNGVFRTPTAKEVVRAQELYAYKALHETLHLAKQGGYRDEELATVAYALADKEAPTAPKNLTGAGRAMHFSAKFDDELKKHCPFPK